MSPDSSCRIAAYRSNFRRFTDVTLAEFDNDQVQQFIGRWFSSELDKQSETAKKYWELLQKPEYKAVKELAQTPLLLTFLCLIYDREQTLTANRSTLYSRALNIILDEWSAQKRLERDPIYEGLHPELEKLLLADIAYSSFKDDQLFFSQKDITGRITAFLSETLGTPKYLNGEAVLKAIEVQQGILVERATDAYSFSHLTLQEYLTADYIIDHQLASKIVDQHLYDEQWREVFLLVAGLVRNQADRLLETIEQKARNDVSNYRKITSIVKWARAAVANETSLGETVSRQVSVLALALASANANAMASAGAFDSARALARTSDSIDALALAWAFTRTSINVSTRASDLERVCELARARDNAQKLIRAGFLTIASFNQLPEKLLQLEKARPEDDATPGQWKQWAIDLESAWFNALELNPEQVSFSAEEAKAFWYYLYATELLIRCKESAIRISQSAWEKIEARLLTFDEVPN